MRDSIRWSRHRTEVRNSGRDMDLMMGDQFSAQWFSQGCMREEQKLNGSWEMHLDSKKHL
jgi:hypothetical protein